MSSSPIETNLARIASTICAACERSGRSPDEVRLLPVSKTHPISSLRQAIDAGYSQFGENRVQEMSVKAEELGGSVSWVLLGHLQRNKVRLACQFMAELQSLDSLRLAEKLDRHLQATGSAVDVLVEVNSSGEESKSGVSPNQLMEFTKCLRSFDSLRVRGLMTVGHPDPERADHGFAMMRTLQRHLQDRDGGGWEQLSMGMSGDFESAIAHGSTCVRIGTAIFGTREESQKFTRLT